MGGEVAVDRERSAAVQRVRSSEPCESQQQSLHARQGGKPDASIADELQNRKLALLAADGGDLRCGKRDRISCCGEAGDDGEYRQQIAPQTERCFDFTCARRNRNTLAFEALRERSDIAYRTR